MYLMDGPLDYYDLIFTFYKGGSQFKPFCGHSKFWSIINFEHDTFAVWNLARSWTISAWLDLKIKIGIIFDLDDALLNLIIQNEEKKKEGKKKYLDSQEHCLMIFYEISERILCYQESLETLVVYE